MPAGTAGVLRAHRGPRKPAERARSGSGHAGQRPPRAAGGRSLRRLPGTPGRRASTPGYAGAGCARYRHRPPWRGERAGCGTTRPNGATHGERPPRRADPAHLEAPGSCRFPGQPAMSTCPRQRTAPPAMSPRCRRLPGCLAGNVRARSHGLVYVNPGCGTAAPAGPPRASSAQPSGATIFPCACRAFLAGQNRRFSRSSTAFPPLRGAPRPVLA